MDEKKLIELAQNGDINARNSLLINHLNDIDIIFNTRIYCKYGDKDRYESEGIIGLLKAIKTYNTDKNISFNTYAYRCILNEMLMLARVDATKSKREISLNKKINSFRELQDVIKSDDEIDDNIIAKEEQEIACDCLEEIPDKHKTIIKLYYGFANKDYSKEELASKFNCSKIVVDNYLNRGTTMIREKLSDNYGYKIKKMKRK